eukprot:TRINITY_DN60754_c0_g1_i1.p1 TRINITY_DN60754_c0_g1~~TRINITY_DN60754_c0_g1_i1.p1  ORF type:complete len:726 (-),score=139.50 TRINITY_DN60754_c0_g1_i1:51-2228(-)
MAGLSLTTVKPLPELAMTNKVYVSQQDLVQLCGTGPQYVEVKGCIFSLAANASVQTGTVCFNKVQREWARIAIDTAIFVKGYVPPASSDIGTATVEVDFYLKRTTPPVEMNETEIEEAFRKCYTSQVLAVSQTMALEVSGHLLKFTMSAMAGLDLGTGKPVGKISSGVYSSHTELTFQQGPSGKLQVLSTKGGQRSIFRPDFNFEDLGIGGLSKEFGDIFRRAFAARIFPPHVVRDLGINHVRGMLLHGPPGTGKTLIARQLAKFLKAAEPKIVNGPEVLNKYVGQSEENIRLLFADAEKEYKQQGENSQLHIVVFDEIDAICKSRGSRGDSTGVGDGIVNQLLSKIDGVDALNNILIIGMTNRIDLMDEALLRPGRLEVHVEISLPNEQGRVEILNIHTKSMRSKGYLANDVRLGQIAGNTKNFSGAELEGLVRSATSFALNRKVDVTDISKPTDLTDITVTPEDFENAMLEVKPAFGCHEDEFEQCCRHGIVRFSSEFEEVLSTCESLVEQVRTSENTPLLSVLLSGLSGSGKTALSAHLAQSSNYPFVRRISNENFVGYTEQAKVNAMVKVFEDAYKSSLSVIVLDDIERLMDYVRLGPRFSNHVLQALFALLKKVPPKPGRRLLVFATSSDPNFLEESELLRVFNVVLSVPVLREAAHFRAVVQSLPGFTPGVAEEISTALAGQRIGVKTIHVVAEMALQRQNPVTKAAFLESLRAAGSFD